MKIIELVEAQLDNKSKVKSILLGVNDIESLSDIIDMIVNDNYNPPNRKDKKDYIGGFLKELEIILAHPMLSSTHGDIRKLKVKIKDNIEEIRTIFNEF